MNCSAEKASRKWAYGAFGRTAAAMVTVAAVALLGVLPEPALAGRVPGRRHGPICSAMGRPGSGETRHRAAVPLPKPRPAEAPKTESGKAEPGRSAAEEPPEPGQSGKSTEPQPSSQPSACRLALTDAIAIAPAFPTSMAPAAAGAKIWCGLRRSCCRISAGVGEACGDPALRDGHRARRLDPDRHRATGGKPRQHNQ